MNISRAVKHLFGGPWQVRRSFPKPAMANIANAIRQSERSHTGEIRFAVEAALPLADWSRGVRAQERAVEVFSQLHVWDTECNNGVLIYLLLAERDVEIVADRGVHAHAGSAGWEAVCREMEAEFRNGRFEAGVLLGIARITAILQRHFSSGSEENPNELHDAPVVL